MKNTRKLISLLLIIALVCSLSSLGSPIYASSSVPEASDFVPGQVLVGLKTTMMFTSMISAENLFPGVNAVSVTDLTDVSDILIQNEISAPMSYASANNPILLLELADGSEQGVWDAIEVLENNPNVAYAEPNWIGSACAIPNDLDYSFLWGMEKIGMPDAWDIETGSASVMVGVMDSGVDYYHEDLMSNVDYTLGYDFALDSPDPMDDSGHGTHVAGTIGAIGNNEIGVVGVNWNVTIVPLKIWYYGSGTVSDLIEAIYYADYIQIPILNLSGRWFPGWLAQGDIPSMRQAIEDYSGLLIAAAGNENIDNDDIYEYERSYPAALDCDNIISVAATDAYDDLCGFSSFGKTTVDLAAPGQYICSTAPWGYYYDQGTSMAAPHVTGVAALLKAYRPDLTPREIKAAILDNVDTVPALDDFVATGGRLNAYKALQSVMPKVMQIAGGSGYTLLLMDDGTVWARGANYYGQCGTGFYSGGSGSVGWTQVVGLTDVVQISAGVDHNLAVQSNGTFWTWGNNSFGKLGNNTYTGSNVPVAAEGITGNIFPSNTQFAIAAGGSHSLAVERNGNVYAWGDNGSGQLGDGTWNENNYPSPIYQWSDWYPWFSAVSAGMEHSLALTEDGKVLGWGNNIYNQAFPSSNYSRWCPVPTIIDQDAVGIAAGGYQSFMVKDDGTLWMWGYSPYAPYIFSTGVNAYDTPTQLDALTDIVAVAANCSDVISLALALDADGFVWTDIDSPNPQKISGLSDVVAIALGEDHYIALKSDGTLWTWGDNTYGQLGYDTEGDWQSTPRQVLFNDLVNDLPMAS